MKIYLGTIAAALSVALLAGCNMTTPTQVTANKIEIRKTARTETLDILQADAARAEIVAAAYKKNGTGPMSVTVSYLDGDRAGVKRRGDAFRQHLKKSGVRNVDINYVTISDRTRAGKVVLSWLATVASAPDECNRRLPGLHGAEDLQSVKQYSYGCEILNATAKQVSRPADLLGRSGVPEEEAMRAGELVNDYRSGVPNDVENDGGTTASDVASSGGGGG